MCVQAVSYSFGHLADYFLGNSELQFLVDQFVELVQTAVHQLHEYPYISLHTHMKRSEITLHNTLCCTIYYMYKYSAGHDVVV